MRQPLQPSDEPSLFAESLSRRSTLMPFEAPLSSGTVDHQMRVPTSTGVREA